MRGDLRAILEAFNSQDQLEIGRACICIERLQKGPEIYFNAIQFNL